MRAVRLDRAGSLKTSLTARPAARRSIRSSPAVSIPTPSIRPDRRRTMHTPMAPRSGRRDASSFIFGVSSASIHFLTVAEAAKTSASSGSTASSAPGAVAADWDCALAANGPPLAATNVAATQHALMPNRDRRVRVRGQRPRITCAAAARPAIVFSGLFGTAIDPVRSRQDN